MIEARIDGDGNGRWWRIEEEPAGRPAKEQTWLRRNALERTVGEKPGSVQFDAEMPRTETRGYVACTTRLLPENLSFFFHKGKI
jgi:hypothetical protein